MLFSFAYVCDLLQQIDDEQRGRTGQRRNTRPIQEWFSRHRSLLQRDDADVSALLSTLLPEKRTDRVYCIQAKSLQNIVARALGLGRSRINELARWATPGLGVDLADCVEDILRATPNPPWQGPAISVEEIDGILHGIASKSRFSSPAVRASNPIDRESTLGHLFKQLPARDAKWLTRLILKDFTPVALNPDTVFQCYNPLLPLILRVQDDFSAAVSLLRHVNRTRGVTQGPLRKDELMKHLTPRTGIKVGRPQFWKGRSIKHCMDMGYGRMSCERKVDGEYCQVHIDISKGRNCVQIFSKSGKDSTRDRVKLHSAIRSSLQLGDPSCKVKKNCILEGELVVYSERENKILGFDKIRKHVSRSGVFLRTDQDSQTHEWEHLMIVYFDLLLLDGESLLGSKQSERFDKLNQLITCETGQAELVHRIVIDFGRGSAASDLRRAFARCITAREEGLVLKPDVPYFDFGSSRGKPGCSYIKLKKEFVGSFGDVGDFAVVGARYEAVKAKTYGIPNLKWTHFLLGCLENKEEARSLKEKPRFVVTNVVELNPTQMKSFMQHTFLKAVSPEENVAFDLRVEPGVDEGRVPSIVFADPPVFDLRCFSFHRGGNTGFWSMRFPVVTKIHLDRTYMDTISFEELQSMAREEKEEPPPEDSQEMMRWVAALESADPKGIPVDFMSQSTASTGAAISLESSPNGERGQLPPSDPMPQSPIGSLSRATRSARQATTRAQATPPRSSFAESPDDVMLPTVSGASRLNDRRQKRRGLSMAESPRQPKRRRLVDARPTPSSAPSSQSLSFSASMTHREPLGDITRCSQTRDNSRPVAGLRLSGASSFSMPTSGGERLGVPKEAKVSSSAAASFHTAPTVASSSARSTLPSSPPVLNLSPPHRSPLHISGSFSSAECRYSGKNCALVNFSVLLAPCIAEYPWAAEDLLSDHGITQVHTDPHAWNRGLRWIPSSSLSSTTNRDTGEEQALVVGNPRESRPRKIVLVESKRKKATEDFLRRIGAAGLRRSNGDRKWVDVYDWRLLEVFSRHEAEQSGCRGDSSSMTRPAWVKEVFRKYFVGIA